MLRVTFCQHLQIPLFYVGKTCFARNSFYFDSNNFVSNLHGYMIIMHSEVWYRHMGNVSIKCDLNYTSHYDIRLMCWHLTCSCKNKPQDALYEGLSQELHNLPQKSIFWIYFKPILNILKHGYSTFWWSWFTIKPASCTNCHCKTQI